jgi:long-chain fatty acid transport protein
MLGAGWDPSPVRDGYVSPDLPDANRMLFTAGISYYPAPKFSIIAALEYVNASKRDASYDEENFGGTYKTVAWTPGIGLAYHF